MIGSEPEKQYASEGCHAYDWDGNPHHSVPYSDKKRQGEMRPTTLRDIKKNGWLPSVSSILAIQAKPGLDGWKKREVAKAAWGWSPNHEWPDEESYVESILANAETNMSRARDLGSEIHGAIEFHLKEAAYAERFDLNPLGAHSRCVEAAVDALKELGVWGQPFAAERAFASPLGYGGCIDLCGSGWVLDFKCVDSLEKKLDYPDRVSQLVAYCDGRHVENIHTWQIDRLWNCFISTSEPGEYLIREYDFREKFQGLKLFDACFTLWKVANQYDPLNDSLPGVSK